MKVFAARRRGGVLLVHLGVWLFFLAVVASPAASAEGGEAPPEKKAVAPKLVAPDSPRASLQRFLDLSRAGQFEKAAQFLQVPPTIKTKPAQLAERLKVVLDRNVWFQMDEISASSTGNVEDALPADREDVATITGPDGVDPVRMVKVEAGEGARWMFSAATVSRVNTWYDRLGDRWIRDHLPDALLRPGPRELLWWQWGALPVLFLVALVVGRALGWGTRRLLEMVFKRTRTQWDDVLLNRMAGPLTLVWGIAACYVLLPWLSLYEPAEMFVERVLRAAFYVSFFWALLRTVDVAADFLNGSTWGVAHRAIAAFIPLGVRIAKVVVLAMAAIAILSELGFPVASLIAGLGIGGLALALAAQKTVENLFGSVSLGVDQPIRVGDFVKVEDFVGTVESIGLRSTRIRTLGRTLVSIPNGKLADMRLETFAPRDRILFNPILGVVYGTTEAQMRAIVTRCEQLLREHPRVWKEAIRVVFTQFGASSLDIEVFCWFETPDWNEFNYLRQDVLLRFMKVVEEEGSSFAFPSRTVHLVQTPSPALKPSELGAKAP